jgi:alpha-tubulin suppressor-like RCC1 family protein
VASDQKAWCWGLNIVAPASKVNSPSQVPGGLQFNSIGGGLASIFSCGVVTTGKAYCWGWNGAGQLGDGTTTSHYTPKPVVAP